MADIPWWDQFDVTDRVVFAPGSEGFDYDDTSPWANVSIGGNRLPGTCVVAGAAVHRIDVQKANGVDGGTLIERGYEPGKFDVDCKVWTRSQWRILLGILPQIFRRPNKIDVNDAKAKKAGATAAEIEATATAAKPVTGPMFDFMNVGSCLIQSVGIPRPGPEWGTWVVSIKCVEYIAPNPKNAGVRKTTGSKDTAPLHQKLTPATNKPPKPSESGHGGPNGEPVTAHGSS